MYVCSAYVPVTDEPSVNVPHTHTRGFALDLNGNGIQTIPKIGCRCSECSSPGDYEMKTVVLSLNKNSWDIQSHIQVHKDGLKPQMNSSFHHLVALDLSSDKENMANDEKVTWIPNIHVCFAFDGVSKDTFASIELVFPISSWKRFVFGARNWKATDHILSN